MSIRMWRQQTQPRSTTSREIWRKVKALHGDRLCTRFRNVVEDIGSRIPEGESPIRSHLWRRKERTHVMSAWKQWDRHIWTTRRWGICQGNRNRRWASPRTRQPTSTDRIEIHISHAWSSWRGSREHRQQPAPLPRESDCPAFGNRSRKHRPQPAPPPRGSDCPMIGSSKQEIKPSTASISSSADGESCHKELR